MIQAKTVLSGLRKQDRKWARRLSINCAAYCAACVYGLVPPPLPGSSLWGLSFVADQIQRFSYRDTKQYNIISLSYV